MIPFYETHDVPLNIVRGEFLNFPMHIHKEIELFYIENGNHSVSFSGIEHTMVTDELAIAFPNEPHAYYEGSGTHLAIIFDADICPDFAAVFRHYRPEFPFLKVSAASKDLSQILHILNALPPENLSDPKLLKGYLTIILFRMMEQLPLLSEQKFLKQDLTSKVVQYLMQHYESSLSLSDVATALGVSKYEISRVFSNQIKMGFNQYVNRMRLEKAEFLLRTTQQSVTEIAFSCGFESLRTFYRVFSAQYHMTPLDYRQNSLPKPLHSNLSTK